MKKYNLLINKYKFKKKKKRHNQRSNKNKIQKIYKSY